MIKRKIYYVPGMVSLLLLWPLLYDWCQNEQASRDLRVLEVTIPNPKEILPDRIYGLTELPPERDYLTFELTGNAVTDKIKLDYAQIRIHEIGTGADQIHGINIHFTDATKYRSMIKAVDMLIQEKLNILWLWHKKDIWCFAIPPRTTDTPAPSLPFCGTRYIDCIGFEEPQEGFMEDVASLFKSYWPMVIIFSGLMLCAAYFISRRRPAPLKLVRVFTEPRGRQ